MLQSLEMQDQTSWTEMLDQYSTIANSLSQIQEHMKKASGAHDGTDIATLLRTHLTVPQKVSLEVDAALQVSFSFHSEKNPRGQPVVNNSFSASNRGPHSQLEPRRGPDIPADQAEP